MVRHPRIRDEQLLPGLDLGPVTDLRICLDEQRHFGRRPLELRGDPCPVVSAFDPVHGPSVLDEVRKTARRGRRRNRNRGLRRRLRRRRLDLRRRLRRVHTRRRRGRRGRRGRNRRRLTARNARDVRQAARDSREPRRGRNPSARHARDGDQGRSARRGLDRRRSNLGRCAGPLVFRRRRGALRLTGRERVARIAERRRRVRKRLCAQLGARVVRACRRILGQLFTDGPLGGVECPLRESVFEPGNLPQFVRIAPTHGGLNRRFFRVSDGGSTSPDGRSRGRGRGRKSRGGLLLVRTSRHESQQAPTEENDRNDCRDGHWWLSLYV